MTSIVLAFGGTYDESAGDQPPDGEPGNPHLPRRHEARRFARWEIQLGRLQRGNGVPVISEIRAEFLLQRGAVAGRLLVVVDAQEVLEPSDALQGEPPQGREPIDGKGAGVGCGASPTRWTTQGPQTIVPEEPCCWLGVTRGIRAQRYAATPNHLRAAANTGTNQVGR